MKKSIIVLLSAALFTANAVHAYDISIATVTNGTLTSSHSTANSGQIVTLMATPESGYEPYCTVVGTQSVAVKEPTGVILNGEGTTLDGWVREREGSTQWAILDGNSFATSYDIISMSQTCTLTDLGFSETQLDASPSFTASVDMWVYSRGAKVARAVVAMLDASGNELGKVTVADDREGHDWQTYTKTFTLVSGTRQLKYTLTGQDNVYWTGYYGPRFRNVDIQTDVRPAKRSAITHCLRFVMPEENVTVRAYYEPTDPDVAVDDDLLVWTSYRRHFHGSGTADDPYTIENAAQLAQLAYDVNNEISYEGKIFVQTADIDLHKTVDGKRVQWKPIGLFDVRFTKTGLQFLMCSFNGKYFGHKLWGNDATNRRYAIKNMFIDNTDDNSNPNTSFWGLFGWATNTLCDITITDADIHCTPQSGNSGLLCGFCGYLDEQSEQHDPDIWGCSVQGKIDFNGKNGNLGGIVGKVCGFGTTSIEHCKADVTIVSSSQGSNIGGIAGGLQNVSISDCTARVNISSSDTDYNGKYGGIVGHVEYSNFYVRPNPTKRNVITACTASGSITAPSAKTGDNNHLVGGIAGDVKQTLVASCISMVDISSNGKVGGIVGQSDAGGTSDPALLEHNVFAGHIDGSTAEIAAGLVGKVKNCRDQHISNNLMIGTISEGSNPANCYAIAGSLTKSDGTDGDPLVVVANSYYDTTLCNAQALPSTAQPHPTVLGATTSVLTSGNQQDLRYLLSDDNKGFNFNKGYYPQVFSTSHWLLLANDNDASAYNTQIENFYSNFASNFGSNDLLPIWKDTTSDDGTVRASQYKSGAWLASLPLTITEGDFAYDLVATVSAKQQNAILTEHSFNAETQTWEDKELRTANSVSIPKDLTFIKVDGLKATPVTQGNFDITLGLSTLARPFHFDIVSLGTIWDGTKATGFRTGDGTAVRPYIIRTPQELAYAVNNSEEGKYYRQICDLWLNEQVIREAYYISTPFLNRDLDYNRKWYANTTWRGHYDGAGHIVNGMYHYALGTYGNTYGLFGTISASASVETLGVANSWIKFNTQDNDIVTMCMGMIAGECYGLVRGCLTSGVIDAYTPNNSFRCVGGIVGQLTSSGLIEDCVEAVAMRYHSFVAGSFADRRLSKGTVRHCLALAPIIYSYFYAPKYEKDCHYPRGYRFMAEEGYEHEYTDDDLTTLNEAFGGSKLWQTEEGYYPMLKAFAGTTIGKMMTLTFSPDEGDSMMGFQRQITFNPGSLTWEASGAPSYVEFDADMGVVTPRMTASNYEWDYFNFLMGWSADKKNLLVIGAYPNSNYIEEGITFEDDNARQACLAAFDKDNDGILTLAEVKKVANEQTLTAFQTNTARKIKTFPEFRYFKAVTELSTQLSQMKALESIDLPYALQTVGSDAFQGCTSLKEVTLPAKVSTVDEHPFYGSAVENVYVDKFNEHFQSRDGLLFDMDDRLIAYPNGRTGSATLSGDISEIAAGAIYKLTDCDSIFIDAPNYWDVIYLNEGGIEGEDGALHEIYVNDATYDQTLLDAYLGDDSWWDYVEADRLHRYYPLTVTSAKAATMYIGFDTQLPDGLKPYIVKTTSEDDGIAYLTQLTDSRDKKTTQVPMLTPVVIFAEAAGQYKLFPLDEELEPFPMWKNLLIGSDRDGLPVYQEDAARGNILTLGRNSKGTLGFFYYKGKQIPPYRAYLAVNDITGANAFSLSIDIDDTTTTIHETESANHPLENVVYNLNGQRISHRQLGKGVYIINGKKILIR